MIVRCHAVDYNSSTKEECKSHKVTDVVLQSPAQRYKVKQKRNENRKVRGSQIRVQSQLTLVHDENEMLTQRVTGNQKERERHGFSCVHFNKTVRHSDVQGKTRLDQDV
ncbi:hypothetical protein DR999_PMT10407 [Platysternon megacephalum]|uniref:Uncharacterized protein n=1 Tax=Platysternon megacephalum TaxID=55544 RepID=A0A4D9EE91_9SAUR|nr:hypothetical protein DR999_PMT10407 [Platysternon megacephalum]